MFRLVTLIYSLVLLTMCNTTKKVTLGAEEYFSMKSVNHYFDSILTTQNNGIISINIYYKQGCSLVFEKDYSKNQSIRSKFNSYFHSHFKNNSNCSVIDSTVCGDKFNYKLFDPLNGYYYTKGIINKDTIKVIQLKTKDKHCDLFNDFTSLDIDR